MQVNSISQTRNNLSFGMLKMGDGINRHDARRIRMSLHNYLIDDLEKEGLNVVARKYFDGKFTLALETRKHKETTHAITCDIYELPRKGNKFLMDTLEYFRK